MSIAGFFTITRPANAVISGVTAIIAYLVATGTIVPSTILLLVIVTLITAAGNVINDYFDTDIDRINRPERPIPSGLVTPSAARYFAVMLFVAGIIVALFTPMLCLAIVIINSVILVLYAAKLKGMPVIGNAAVAYLAASIFLFGGAFAGWDTLVHVVPLAAITFFATMVREILKDAEDVEGDMAGGADTLPIRIGVPLTTRIAVGFALVSVVASVVPFLWWGAWYLAGIVIVDIIILAAVIRTLGCAAPACIRATRSTTFIKAGMFAALLVFALSAVFL
ncbi:MAG: geranylgeranylglycerol-phosphate geranylgeranyltransferase [Methanomicrobiales archaeon HGW-Methanomicrobiales-1]|jgi:geranylgeranylglycerol-phosphate geranylgeranyltransferase|nr:MAG: geranylgeranylglycerol-phosphate geranylgeranyltransferase [Methanomicrobiales archaeon HGW-Methanomicrobiales-1]